MPAPSIFCADYVTDTGDLTYENIDNVVLVSGGDITAILRCSTSTSGAVGAVNKYEYLSAEDFNTLWPALAGLLVAGYIVKRLLAAF